jgi:hypothetical protein
MRQDHSNRINGNVSGCIGVSRPVVILTQRFLCLFLISSILWGFFRFVFFFKSPIFFFFFVCFSYHTPASSSLPLS